MHHRTLIDAGYDGSFNGEAYASIFFQNANHSVRVTDDFMQAVVSDGNWTTHAVTTGEEVDTFPAPSLMDDITDASWICGDPGMQFDTTLNRWHPCKETARIHASNPCSEYMFLDDSACNLASLNLMRFRDPRGDFKVDDFRSAVHTTITAMEIIVGAASYPTEKIRVNSLAYRPLGLGYANLGALLMSRGLPYDSERGRAYAGAITALMTGEAYVKSAQLARVKGPFEGFEHNRTSMLDVIGLHRAHVEMIENKESLPPELLDAARQAWTRAVEDGTEHGFRNALIPVMTLFGLLLPAIIGGSVILEVMFNWPGMGRLFFESMMSRDYPTIMALTFFTACLVLLGTLLADLSYPLVDPRIRFE